MIKHISFDNSIDKEGTNYSIENIQKIALLNNKKYLEENLNDLSLAKIYYLYRDSIENKLYDLNNNIRLNYNDKNEENLPFYFYLSLLIRENENIINFTYSIDYIKKINNRAKANNNPYYRIMISKIIIELIKNYKGLYVYEFYKEEIEKIENENKEIINDNTNIFNELDINWKYEDIEFQKIDEIYAKIIIGLIKKSKFKEYQNTFEIIKQLCVESIDITNIIFNEIKYILDNNEDIKKNILFQIVKIY